MKEKIEIALIKLNRILALKEGQDRCGFQIKKLHQETLQSFIDTGRILSKSEMSKYVSDVDAAISVLSENELVIFSKHGKPIGAYPFTMENRENKVNVNGFQVNVMCAIDALAVSQMYNVPTTIHSQCRINKTTIYLEQLGSSILNKDEASDIYVCVAWEAVDKESNCADSLCTEMFFVEGEKTASTWQDSDFEKREIFILEDAMELARRFFAPLVS
jgi:mercuric reductase